jgi:hypothetical protein
MIHLLVLEPTSFESANIQEDRIILSVVPQGPVLPIDLYNLRIKKISYKPFLESNPNSLGEAISVSGKGVVVADSTGIPWVTGALQSQLIKFVPWVAYHQGDEAFVVCPRSPDYCLGRSFPSRLFCLKCLEEGVVRELRSDAKYPYCKQHQEYSPHRQKKITTT